MDINVGTLKAFLVLDDQFSSRFSTALRAIDQGTSKLNSLGDKLENIGGTLTTRVTAPLVGVAAVAIKFGTDFQRTMNQVQAVTNASEQDFARLKDAATEWGQKTKYSADEAGQAMLELGKAGFTTNQTIAALPTTLELATAAGLSLKDAAALSANVMKTFKLETTDLAKANDILAAAALSSTIDVTDLSETLKYTGPIAAVTGIRLSEVAAAASIMGESGIKASMAGTSMRAALSELLNPTKNVREVLGELGFGAEVASGKTVELTDVLDRLHGHADRAALAMKAFGDRGGVGVIALAEKGGAALTDLANQFERSEGSAKRMADATMKDVPGALERLKGALETAGMKLLEAMEKPLLRVLSVAERLATVFTNQLIPAFQALPEPLQTGTFAFLGLAAAAGPVLVLLGSAMKVFGVAADGAKAMGKSLEYLAKMFSPLMSLVGGLKLYVESHAGLGTASSASIQWLVRIEGAVLAARSAFAVLTGPIGLAITLLSGLAAWALEHTKLWPTLTSVLGSSWSIFKDLASIIKDGLVIAFMYLRAASSAVWDSIKTTWGVFSDLYRVVVALNPEIQRFNRFLDYVALAASIVAVKIRGIREDMSTLATVVGVTPTMPTVRSPLTSPSVAGPLPIPTGALSSGVASIWTPSKLTESSAAVGDLTSKVKSLRDAQAETVIAAKAYAEFMGSSWATQPLKLKKDYYNALQDVIDQYGSLKAAGLDSLQAVYDRLSRSVGAVQDMREEMVKLVGASNAWGVWQFQQRANLTSIPLPQRPLPQWQVPVGNPSQGLNQPGIQQWLTTRLTVQLTPAPKLSLSQHLFGMTTSQMGANLSQSIMQAIQGGGNPGEAAGSLIGQTIGNKMSLELGKKASGFFTTGLGGIISGALPVLGAFLGPVVGKLWDTLSGNKGKRANDLRDKIKETFGDIAGAGMAAYIDKFKNVAGIQAAYKAFMTAGSEEAVKTAFEKLKKLLDDASQTMAKYGLSIDDLQSPHERLSSKLKELADDYANLKEMGFGDDTLAKAMSSQLNEVLRAALETGERLPAALEPLLVALARGGGIAEDLAAKLLGIPQRTRVDWQRMQAAAERYGITLENLGPQFQQSRLDDMMQELYDDWMLLNIPGANTNEILSRMAPKVQDVLNNALRWGLEIPASMRPFIQALIDAGLLTDETGKKLTDISKLNFAEDLTTKVEDLVEAIRELIGALTGVPPAASAAAQAAARAAQGWMQGGYQSPTDPEPRNPVVLPNLPTFPGSMASTGVSTSAATASTATPSAPPTVTVVNNIYAIDGASVERVVQSKSFAESFRRVVATNATGLKTTISGAVA